MSSRTPLHGGIVVATLWLLAQVILWAAAALATVFLSVLLASLLVAAANPDNWKGLH